MSHTIAGELSGYYGYEKLDASMQGSRCATKEPQGRCRVDVFTAMDISIPRVLYSGSSQDEAREIALEYLRVDGYADKDLEIVPSGDDKGAVVTIRHGLGNWTDSTVWILNTKVRLP